VERNRPRHPGLPQPAKLRQTQYDPGQAGTHAAADGPKSRLATVTFSTQFNGFFFVILNETNLRHTEQSDISQDHQPIQK